MVANLRRVGLRYEIDYWITPELRLRSISEHQAIIDLLEAGETEQAISVFIDHWRGGMEHTLKRLNERLGSEAYLGRLRAAWRFAECPGAEHHRRSRGPS